MLETPELLWQNLVRESVREVRYGMRSEVPGIIRLVDHLLERAVALHASDIHLEPQELRVRLRFRIDGILRETITMPANLGPAVTSRIKVMAGMDIAVHQQPQDGHILFQPKGRRIDIRVSSLPASAGEVIVMRLMDVSAQLFSLDELGFSAKDTAVLRELIHRPAGMIVLCGPMNSGKTSSLYAALTELNTESRNLVTLEDPIERILPGVNQEHTGIIRHGAKMLYAYSEATVPKVTVITRKAYGGAYIAMCCHELGSDQVMAWPSAEIAVMGPSGAANIIFRRDPDKEAKTQQYIDDFSNPYVAAERGYVDLVVEPKETRPLLITAFSALASKREVGPAKKHGNIPL